VLRIEEMQPRGVAQSRMGRNGWLSRGQDGRASSTSPREDAVDGRRAL
jgi:hypothetical protein